MSSPSAIFDLDGTLADTAHDLIGTANEMLTSRGMPALGYADTRNAAGMGGRALIRLGYQRAGQEIEDGQVEELYPEFLEVYMRRYDRKTHLFAGVAATLRNLQAMGWRLGVCTNKPEAPAVALLDRLGLGKLFAVVLGGDTLDVRKPDPRHVLETVARLGGQPRHAAMVGDSRNDFDAAEAAGMPCILMSYGYSSEPVEGIGAAAVTDRFEALPQLLQRLVPGV